MIHRGLVPRVSWWLWLLHPIQAYWITFLIREAHRHESENVRPDALTWGEKALFVRVQARIRTSVAAAAARINALAAEQQAALYAAARKQREVVNERARLRTPVSEVKTVAAGPITASAAQRLLTEQQAKVRKEVEQGETRHLDRPSKVRRGFAYVLVSVDVAAIFNAFALLYNVKFSELDVTKLVTVSGFSVIAAGVLGHLAHSTGHTVWEARATARPAGDGGAGKPDSEGAPTPWPGEFPPRKATLIAKMLGLFVVSVLSGLSILTRVVEEATQIDNPVLGWVLGILVACAAVLAPWLVVIDQMRSGSLEIRTIDALTKIVQESNDAVLKSEEAAAKEKERAASLYARAKKIGQTEGSVVDKKAAFVEKVVTMARSLHQRSGRLALLPDSAEGQGGVAPETLAGAIRADKSAVDEALKRLFQPEEPADEPGEPEPDDPDGPWGAVA
jgi:hypothetical protein